MANVIQAMREVFKDSFLQPEAFRLDASTEAELLESGLDLEDGAVYARLSAPGFLDCTDWSGPFQSVEDAAQYLIDTYGE